MTDWTVADFGPTKTGPQWAYLNERLTLHGYPLNKYGVTFKERIRMVQLALGFTGADADGVLGSTSLRFLKSDPVVPTPALHVSTDGWKWTSPLWKDSDKDSPLEVYPVPTNLDPYQPWIQRTSEGTIITRANAGGSHTENSYNSRSEFREKNKDGSNAKWNSFDQTLHVMEHTAKVLQLPPKIPSLVCGQCHDDSDDVFMLNAIGLEDRNYFKLILQESLGKNQGSIKHDVSPKIKIGDPFNYRMEFDRTEFRFYFNGLQLWNIPGLWENCFWKWGTYLQTNVSKGEDPNALGAVETLALNAFHK